MGFLLYKKLFSKLSIALTISFVVSKLIFKSWYFFVFSSSSFGAFYLLLGWLLYLKSDGVTFFKNKSLKIFNFLDRAKYKNNGIYNIYKNDEITETSELSDEEIAKASIYSYALCGLFLVIGSQLLHYFINTILSSD